MSAFDQPRASRSSSSRSRLVRLCSAAWLTPAGAGRRPLCALPSHEGGSRPQATRLLRLHPQLAPVKVWVHREWRSPKLQSFKVA